MNYGLLIRKNWKLLIVLLLMFDFMDAQSQVPRPVPPVYPSTISKNYVRTWDATAPESNSNTLITRPLRDVKQNTQYFDGLGRQLQTVLKQGSVNSYNPTNFPTFTPVVVDIIKPVMYDEFGREQFAYLPFASSATDATKNDGQFKLNPFQQQVAFYNTQLNGQIGEFNVGAGNLNWAYSQTKYEASPFNTVQEIFAPGSSWVGTSTNATESSRRWIKRKYYANTVTDEVRAWYVTVGALPAFSTYSTVTAPAGSPSVYAAGQLQKIITVDEKNNQVIEFKDKEGKLILKKMQLTAAADNNGSGSDLGWLCTYYIYDNSDNLRCVIQPEGVEILRAANWANATVTAILAEQCYRYEYDHRNRMVIAKVPGADEIYTVYDGLTGP